METRKRKSKADVDVVKDKKTNSKMIVNQIFNDYDETKPERKRQVSIKKNNHGKNNELDIKTQNNRFKEKSKPSNNWNTIKTVLIKNYGSEPSSKILGFDLDDTLIRPKSGAKFAKDRSDWEFIMNVEIIRKTIINYINDGYRIVIFSNQNGISKGRTDEKEWKGKVDDIVGELNVPILVLAALESDYYRKPSIGMWRMLETEIDGNKVTVDPKSFIYVGDAAGRDKNYHGKKDHSDSDYKFVINVGGKFKTPEEFFMGHKSILPKKFVFDPKDYKKFTLDEKDLDINEKKQEMVIFVGSPGSGKSSFYSAFFAKHNYVHVNNDTLKTASKCLKVAEEALTSGKSIVIDNTNPTKAVRSSYISLAKNLEIPVRCFFFKYSKELVFHLNNLRDINIGRQHHSKSVPDVVIHSWYKYLEEPSISEGFKDVKVIPFVPGPFENSLDEEIFYLYSS
jgi:bifunctional polynucleotide phosphatase/kinase